MLNPATFRPSSHRRDLKHTTMPSPSLLHGNRNPTLLLMLLFVVSFDAGMVIGVSSSPSLGAIGLVANPLIQAAASSSTISSSHSEVVVPTVLLRRRRFLSSNVGTNSSSSSVSANNNTDDDGSSMIDAGGSGSGGSSHGSFSSATNTNTTGSSTNSTGGATNSSNGPTAAAVFMIQAVFVAVVVFGVVVTYCIHKRCVSPLVDLEELRREEYYDDSGMVIYKRKYVLSAIECERVLVEVVYQPELHQMAAVADSSGAPAGGAAIMELATTTTTIGTSASSSLPSPSPRTATDGIGTIVTVSGAANGSIHTTTPAMANHNLGTSTSFVHSMLNHLSSSMRVTETPTTTKATNGSIHTIGSSSDSNVSSSGTDEDDVDNDDDDGDEENSLAENQKANAATADKKDITDEERGREDDCSSGDILPDRDSSQQEESDELSCGAIANVAYASASAASNAPSDLLQEDERASARDGDAAAPHLNRTQSMDGNSVLPGSDHDVRQELQPSRYKSIVRIDDVEARLSSSVRSSARALMMDSVDLDPTTGGNYDEMCPICMEDFIPNETLVVVLPVCNHVYHKECIAQWLMQKQRCCPMCKLEVAV